MLERIPHFPGTIDRSEVVFFKLSATQGETRHQVRVVFRSGAFTELGFDDADKAKACARWLSGDPV